MYTSITNWKLCVIFIVFVNCAYFQHLQGTSHFMNEPIKWLYKTKVIDTELCVKKCCCYLQLPRYKNIERMVSW